MPTALVTGAAGFVGSNLVEALADRGYAVRGVDNFETGRRSNLEPLDSLPEFSFHEADIRDGDAMTDLMDGVDYLFHQAAVASVPRSVEDPVTTTDANCTGTATVLDAGPAGGVQHRRRPGAVGVGGGDGVLDAARDRGDGGLVEEIIDALDGVGHRVGVPDVGLAELELLAGLERREVLAVPRREVVDAADLVAAVQKCLREVRPDEAGCAGDECRLHTSVCVWRSV